MRISDWSSDVCSSDLLGGVVAASAWVSHPQCLGDPSALIDEDARRLWLGNVREARPIYRQPIQTLIASMSLPFLGLIGFGLAIWENRRNPARPRRSEEHTSELQSLMRISYAVLCLKNKNHKNT